jgi:hypothetical protein
MIGAALRRRTRPVPNGRVRIRSGGMTGTRRVDRWMPEKIDDELKARAVSSSETVGAR